MSAEKALVPIIDLLRQALLQEACASTALAHPDGHDCVVCRAADGDQDALAEVMASIEREGGHERQAHGGDDGMKIQLTLSKREAEMVLRSTLTRGYGARRPAALESAEAKIRWAILREMEPEEASDEQ